MFPYDRRHELRAVIREITDANDIPVLPTNALIRELSAEDSSALLSSSNPPNPQVKAYVVEHSRVDDAREKKKRGWIFSPHGWICLLTEQQVNTHTVDSTVTPSKVADTWVSIILRGIYMKAALEEDEKRIRQNSGRLNGKPFDI